MSIRATDILPKPGLHFLALCYRFVTVEWQHANREDIPDQGFERRFRECCINKLGTEWTVSQPREMQLGAGLDTASGISHEVDIVGRHTELTAAVEMKNRAGFPPDKNDVIVFYAKLIDYANTAYNFFSCVLTTHQQASVSLSQAWGEAGLSAIARLDPASPNSIELPLPSKDQARDIIVAHLDHYRTNAAEKGSIKPFTDDGIEELLKNRQLLHPRVLLTTAAKVVAHAVDNQHNQIDAAVVASALESTATPAATPDVTEGIEGAI